MKKGRQFQTALRAVVWGRFEIAAPFSCYHISMKGLFGLVALLITVGIIIHVISLQLELFQNRSTGEGRGTYGEGSLYVTDQDDILAPIDMAEGAKRALEVKGRIPNDLIR